MLNRLRRDEDGSVLIAVTVIFVVTLLMVTTLSSLYSGLTAARNDQNRTNAFQLANAGMDEAVHRLDRRELPTTPNPGAGYQPIMSGSDLIGFRQTVTVGTGSTSAKFLVEARQDPVGQETVWRVTSTGTDVSGRQRRAIATVTATPLFQNGFLTLENFYLTGTQTSPVSYDSKALGCEAAGAGCEITPVPSRLASNSTIEGADATITHFVSNWQGFEMYGRATQSTADFACAEYRCGTNPKVQPRTNQYVTELPAESEFTDGCPNGGNYGTSITSVTQLDPGNYNCDNLNIQGIVHVKNSGTGRARFFVKNDVNFADKAVVNKGRTTPKFQVFQGTTSTSPGGSICGAEVWGLLYTPRLPVSCSGSAQPKMYGAVVAKLHGGTGSHFDFHWDLQSRNAVHNGKFVIKDWRECPPTATDC